MSVRDYNDNIHSIVFGRGQAQSSSEQAQSSSEQAQSSSEQTSSRSTAGEIVPGKPGVAIQMLLNKNRRIVQNNPIVKKK